MGKVCLNFLILAFLANTLGPVPVRAQEVALPKPGTRVHLSPASNPPVLKGIKVRADNPLRFEFVLDAGEASAEAKDESTLAKADFLKRESTKLIKYFLASLTTPEKDLWVNLSPYEKDRIVPDSFGQTEMGRDLLAQDYLLKQITASLIYPEDEIGKKFWQRVYAEAAEKFGTTQIPVNTFNKVWIVPEKAVVYENSKAGTAYVVESKLKVMLEEDYLAVDKNRCRPGDTFSGRCPQAGGQASQPLKAKATQVNPLTTTQQVLRDIVLPKLEHEVNHGANFSQLRQVYHSLILATWYKKKIKDSILSSVYADKNKVEGLRFPEPRSGEGSDTEVIYQRYLEAFKKGAYNYIKEEIDPVTQQPIPRKYFSGGASMGQINAVFRASDDPAMLSGISDNRLIRAIMNMVQARGKRATTGSEAPKAGEKRPAQTKHNPQATAKRFEGDNGEYVDLEHFVTAMRVLYNREFSAGDYENFIRSDFTADFIDRINGPSYEDPRLGVTIIDQNGFPRLQGILEAVSNSIDAIGAGPEIGQFGKGVKQIIDWLSPNGLDRIDVFTKQQDGHVYHLALRTDENGQWYIHIEVLSESNLLTRGTIVSITVRDPIAEKSVEDELSQERIIRAVEERFRFVDSVGITIQAGQEEPQYVNGWENRRFLVPSDRPVKSKTEHMSLEGKIRVAVASNTISIADNGKGMDARQISRMFVPALGEKQQERITQDNMPRVLRNTALIIDTTDMDDTAGNPPVFSIARNGETVVTYDLSKEVNPRSLLGGHMLLEGSGLIAVTQARDGVQDMHPAVIQRMVTGILHHPDLHDVQKLKAVNTITTVLVRWASGNPENQAKAERMVSDIYLNVRNLVERLKGTHVFLPDGRDYEKLKIPQGEQVIYLNPRLFAWQGLAGLQKLGGVVLDQSSFQIVRHIDGQMQEVPVVGMDFKEELSSALKGPIEDLVLRQPQLPIIKTAEYIIVPRSFIDGILREQDPIRRSSLFQALLNYARDESDTSYKIIRPAVEAKIGVGRPVQTTASQPHGFDSRLVQEYLNKPPSGLQELTDDTPADISSLPHQWYTDGFSIKPFDNTAASNNALRTGVRRLDGDVFTFRSDPSALKVAIKNGGQETTFSLYPGEEVLQSRGRWLVTFLRQSPEAAGQWRAYDLTDGNRLPLDYMKAPVRGVELSASGRFVIALDSEETNNLWVYDSLAAPVARKLSVELQEKLDEQNVSDLGRFVSLRPVGLRRDAVIVGAERGEIFIDLASNKVIAGEKVILDRGEQFVIAKENGRVHIHSLVSPFAVKYDEVSIAYWRDYTFISYSKDQVPGLIIFDKDFIGVSVSYFRTQHPEFSNTSAADVDDFLLHGSLNVWENFIFRGVSTGVYRMPFDIRSIESRRIGAVFTQNGLGHILEYTAVSNGVRVIKWNFGAIEVVPSSARIALHASGQVAYVAHPDQRVTHIYGKNPAGQADGDPNAFKIASGAVTTNNKYILARTTTERYILIDEHGNTHDITFYLPEGYKLLEANGDVFVFHDSFGHMRFFDPEAYMHAENRQEWTQEMRKVKLLWEQLGPERQKWVQDASSSYQVLLEEVPSHLRSGAERALMPAIEVLLGRQRLREGELLKQLIENGQELSEAMTDNLPLLQFVRRMPRLTALFAQEKLRIEAAVMSSNDSELARRVYAHIMENVFAMAADNSLSLDNVTPDVLWAMIFGWQIRSPEDLNNISAIVSLVRNQGMAFKDMRRAVEILYALAHGPQVQVKTVTRQLGKILSHPDSELRANYLRRLYSSLRKINMEQLSRVMQGGQSLDSLGEAKVFVKFLMSDSNVVEDFTPTEIPGRELMGAGVQLPLDEIAEFNRLKPRAEGQSDLYSLQEIAAHVNEILSLPVNAPLRAEINQYVTLQKESGGYAAEVAQNSKDAGARELRVRYYRDPQTGEFVEEMADNGAGPSPGAFLALLVPKSTKAQNAQQGAMSGFFGTGKFTVFAGVDRVEIIANNNQEAYVLRIRVDQKQGRLYLTGIRAIDPLNTPQGVTLRRIKKEAETIPELDQLIGQQTWKIFAGLSQNVSLNNPFQIYLTGDKTKELILDTMQAVRVLAESPFVLNGVPLSDRSPGRLLSVADLEMPSQILDKNGLRVADLDNKPEFLALIPERLKPYIKQLRLSFQIPLPLIQNRNAFEREGEHLGDIQRFIAVEFYKALVRHRLEHEEFSLDPIPHDFETTTDLYDSMLDRDSTQAWRLDPQGRTHLFDVVDRINRGEDIEYALLKQLAGFLEGKSLVAFLVSLSVSTSSGEVLSIFDRRLKVLAAIDRKRAEELAHKHNKDLSKIERAPDAFALQRILRAQDDAAKSMAAVEVKLEGKYQLLHGLALEIGRHFGISDIWIVRAANGGRLPFNGRFSFGRTELNAELADLIEQNAVDGAGRIHEPTQIVIHELAHFFEQLKASLEAGAGSAVSHTGYPDARLTHNEEFWSLMQLVSARYLNGAADAQTARSADPAALSKGGIDFNADTMGLETRNDNGSIKFNVDPAMLKQWQNAPGFMPVIIDLQPMTDLRLFLGLTSDKSENIATL